MRTFKIVIFLLLTCFYVSGQSLYDFYIMLPDKVTLGNNAIRKQMVKNHKAGIKDIGGDIYFRLDVVDEKNGFLNVVGAFEGMWEMCYWNIENKKLIAVYMEGCGPVCYIEVFKFFIYDNGKLIPQEIESIIPGYKSIEKDFYTKYSENLIKELDKKDIRTSVLFRIPRKGKDIVAKFGDQYSKDDLSKFSNGNRMLLSWQNGKFIKSKIYWSK